MTISDHHIPDDDIREAFDLAVTAFIHWDRGGGEPKVTLNGEPCLISTVALLAETFKEPMHTSLFWRMAAYANRTLERTGAVELSKDSSYETGARCLLRWVRKANSSLNSRKPPRAPRARADWYTSCLAEGWRWVTS
jgi:hypothetical protein